MPPSKQHAKQPKLLAGLIKDDSLSLMRCQHWGVCVCVCRECRLHKHVIVMSLTRVRPSLEISALTVMVFRELLSLYVDTVYLLSSMDVPPSFALSLGLSWPL